MSKVQLIFEMIYFVHLLSFCSVKEACIILCLNVGSAILLRSLIKESDTTRDCAGTGDPPPESALNELGVFCLAPCDVLILLSLRTSWFPS